ncbi:MAG: hypothetical protein QMC79_09645 [Anaerosomatales bacterium]|nr:hypothetical protein [Anaerosomatales bacterium]
MSTAKSLTGTLGDIVRFWPVVALVAVLGAVVGGGFGWATRPTDQLVATTTVRYVAPTNAPGVPTADTIVAMALAPSVQASAAETLGLESDALAGAQAAVSARDRTLIEIRVPGNDEDLIVKKAEALARAAADEAMEPYQIDVAYWEARAEADREIVAVLEQNVARIEAVLERDDLDVATRLEHEQLLAAERRNLLAAEQTLAGDLYQAANYAEATAVFGDTLVTESAGITYAATGVLRGSVIGLFFGALLAGYLGRRADATPARGDA